MDKIAVGVVAKPQGLKGEIKVQVYSSEMSHLVNVTSVFVACKEYGVASSAIRQGSWYIKLQGLNSINDVENLRGQEVFILRSQAHKKNKNEEYVVDMLDCKIVDKNGKEYGTVDRVENYGASDIIFCSSKTNFSFPNVAGVIKKYDIDNQKIVVDAKRFEEVVVYEN